MQEIEAFRRVLRFLLLRPELLLAVVPSGETFLIDIALLFNGGVRSVEEEKLVFGAQQCKIVVLPVDVDEIGAKLF